MPLSFQELKVHLNGCGESDAQQYGRTCFVDQRELASVITTFASTRPVHAIAELCGAMSRKPFQVLRFPRVAGPVLLPVGHLVNRGSAARAAASKARVTAFGSRAITISSSRAGPSAICGLAPNRAASPAQCQSATRNRSG